MMPIAALASDLALFDFPAFFAAIFFFPRIDMKVSFAQLPGFPAAQMSAPLLQPSSPLTFGRSEEHTSELQSHLNLVCRLLLEKKKTPAPSYISLELVLRYVCLSSRLL